MQQQSAATTPCGAQDETELAAIARSGMVLPGSITQRRTRCGRRNCACHADPPRLHGPYWQWTRKVAAKTICRWLTTDQHRDYQPWIVPGWYEPAHGPVGAAAAQAVRG